MATLDLNLPAGLPPEGVTANFENPPNNNALAWGVLLLCQVISTVCLVLRGYARVFLLRKFSAEEGKYKTQARALWFFLIGTNTSSFYLARIIEVPGFFVHQWNVLLRDVIPMNYVSQPQLSVFEHCYSSLSGFFDSCFSFDEENY
ncbi:unnamed protein product, partial [Clonostachys solani]